MIAMKLINEERIKEIDRNEKNWTPLPYRLNELKLDQFILYRA